MVLRAVRDILVEASVSGKARVVLGSAFDRAWFVSAGSDRNEVRGKDFEEPGVDTAGLSG